MAQDGWLREDQVVADLTKEAILQTIAGSMERVELGAVEDGTLCWYPSRLVATEPDGRLVLVASDALRQSAAGRPGSRLLLCLRGSSGGYVGQVLVCAEGPDDPNQPEHTIAVSPPAVFHLLRRREHQRLRLSPPIEAQVSFAGMRFRCQAVVEDVSVSGARVRVFPPTPDGSELPVGAPAGRSGGVMRFELPGSMEPLCCEICIAWCQYVPNANGDQSMVMGVSWPHMAAVDKARLSDFLATLGGPEPAGGLSRRGTLLELLTSPE